MNEKSSELQTPITFRGYRIKQLEYGFDVKPAKNGMKIQYGVSDDKKHGQVTFLVEFNDDKEVAHGILQLVGQFDLRDNLSEEDIAIFLGQNGSAILYPYVRSVISMVTSLDNNHVQILPTLNFANLLRNNKISREE
ncbi:MULTISPECIES: protein-export chaperone SecB [Limosilactobacillus]|uniref:protein-export chaperone SecB n=1 Tax=Limosilactobacillus TaxID=2742598 RepID=UPI0022E35ADF|nr:MULTISPECIES: protein-export chaperone SecB [Limosilactobacillus]MDM8332042.1 protein-export chaperone SecB [Limosilactobacillus pontis]